MEQNSTISTSAAVSHTVRRRPMSDTEFRQLVHDLRGPLTSLQLGIETLQTVAPDPEMARALDQLLSEVHRLTARLEAASASRKHSIE